MNRLFIVMTLSLALFAPAGHAETTVAGVKLPDDIQLAGERLVLNGAGIRSKFFIKVYVGALYLRERSMAPDAILAMPGAKSMHMHMLYKEVSAEKIRDGWTDGFKANLSGPAFDRLQPRLRRFNALFPALHAGEHVEMNYLPGTGTELRINGRLLGTIEGADFFAALLTVWTGDKPADKALKRGLLGNH